MLPVAILAGGLATRLRPLTDTIPKALVEVAGEPFVLRQIKYLRAQGVSKVVLCVSYRGEQIEAVVGNGRDFGLDVRYSFDGRKLLGTGGALKRALPLLGERFFILYGDSFLPVDFGAVQAAFTASGKPALMTVLRNADHWDRSNVRCEGGEILEYNKRAPRPDMAYIDYGLSVLSAAVLGDYPDGEAFDLADVMHRLSLAGQLAGLEVFERFYEIGSHQGLAETEAYFREAT
jgi:NDP-sugar pyrophosphorylase family protein